MRSINKNNKLINYLFLNYKGTLRSIDCSENKIFETCFHKFFKSKIY